ncbi:MAG: hypothetical protein LBQ81_05905, partial [Zoogloeaceae bacterium]|nr:hypothetical protein [Zoogloeaceae bacterium]
SRFQKHSDAELVKTAYWRGVCEKDQIFQGKTPDMSAFDAKLSDRAALQKLPDVADLKDLEIHRAKTQGRARDGDHGLEL